jgi:hypothetical protein
VLPPSWIKQVQAAFVAVRSKIDTEQAGLQMESNKVLEQLRPELEKIGFEVEKGKAKVQKILRPVLFGEMGEVGMSYDIDAYESKNQIVFEVEAVRTIRANALYKALIEMSLMVDARYGAIAVPLRYQYKSGTEHPYQSSLRIVDAIYTSGRLKLPLDGFLLVGY